MDTAPLEELRECLTELDREQFCEDCNDVDTGISLEVPALWLAVEYYPPKAGLPDPNYIGNGYCDAYLCGLCALKNMERENQAGPRTQDITGGWYYCSFVLISERIRGLRRDIAHLEEA